MNSPLVHLVVQDGRSSLSRNPSFALDRMVHSIIIEQMSLLGLMWDSEGPIVTDDSESAVSFSQIQMKQRRLFWTHMVGDAFFAASIGMLPKMYVMSVFPYFPLCE